jgi:hypothetical protein
MIGLARDPYRLAAPRGRAGRWRHSCWQQRDGPAPKEGSTRRPPGGIITDSASRGPDAALPRKRAGAVCAAVS